MFHPTLINPLSQPSSPQSDEDHKMADLTQQIAARRYNVDPDLVAAEILRKLRLIKSARQELRSGSDRIPGSLFRDR